MECPLVRNTQWSGTSTGNNSPNCQHVDLADEPVDKSAKPCRGHGVTLLQRHSILQSRSMRVEQIRVRFRSDSADPRTWCQSTQLSSLGSLAWLKFTTIFRNAVPMFLVFLDMLAAQALSGHQPRLLEVSAVFSVVRIGDSSYRSWW